MKPKNFVEKQFTLPSELESRSLIGFSSFQFPIHKIENATVEHILVEIFTANESYVNNFSKNYVVNAIGKVMGYLIMAEVKDGEDKIDRRLATNSMYKISSTCFGIILSCYIIYAVYTKFTNAFVIK